jgi:cell division protein FtsN
MSKESQALTLPATHEVKQLPVASKGQITATKKLPATSQMSVRKTSLKSAKTYPPKIASGTHYYKVQAGVFRDKTKAQALIERIAADGFDTYLKKVAADWRVQVGAFREKIEAKTLQDQLADKGFTSVVIYE